MSCETPQHLQLGAIGALIIVTVEEDGEIVNLASVTTKNFVLKKPNGVTVTKTALFFTDGTDGKLKYTTIAGDLDKAGEWKIQADLVFPSGYDGPTKVETFQVLPNN